MPKLLTDISQEYYNALGNKYHSTMNEVGFLFYVLLVEAQIYATLGCKLEDRGYKIQKKNQLGEPFVYTIVPQKETAAQEPRTETLDISPMIKEVLRVDGLGKIPDFKIAYDPYLDEKAGEVVDKYLDSIVGYFSQKLIAN